MIHVVSVFENLAMEEKPDPAASALSSVDKINRFFNDDAYERYIHDVSHYNGKLLRERRMRMPFFDIQTGLAQTNSSLWKDKRLRLPGATPGQLYVYPHKRWLRRRRQYMSNFFQVRSKPEGMIPESVLEAVGESAVSVGNPLVNGEESRDSASGISEGVLSKESWYYDDYGLVDEEEDWNDPGEDDDYDYEDSYSKRKKKKGGGGKSSKKGGGAASAGQAAAAGGGGSKKTPRPSPVATPSFSEFGADADKPFACELCGARYKTRPGLTYHYSHTHKDAGPPSRNALLPQQMSGGSFTQNPTWTQTPEGGGPPQNAGAPAPGTARPPDALAGLERFQDNFLTFLKTTDPPRSAGADGAAPAPPVPGPRGPEGENEEGGEGVGEGGNPEEEPNRRTGISPSTYCDFCLGDASLNKKTNEPEELVSCSDCGRSGHPSCLQFSANMNVSVKKYRWQCIECKCCTICGNSDNDEQLLFCDDCDRGYHMYCLNPPLGAPPEGSWSCELCIDEFHPELKASGGCRVGGGATFPSSDAK